MIQIVVDSGFDQSVGIGNRSGQMKDILEVEIFRVDQSW